MSYVDYASEPLTSFGSIFWDLSGRDYAIQFSFGQLRNYDGIQICQAFNPLGTLGYTSHVGRRAAR